MKAIMLLTLLTTICGAASAQSSGRYSIVRAVVAGGGSTFSTSSRFQLGSTIAQPLAAVPSSSRFSIQGGYWIWPAPTILAPTKVGSNFSLSFQTEPGKTYTVQFVDSLATLNWQSLTPISGDGTVRVVTTPGPGVMQRYFRVIER